MRDVDGEGQLVDELVLLLVPAEAAQQIHHQARRSPIDPNVAVYYPHDIALGLPVRTAHVPDLRVRAQVVLLAILAEEVGVFLFDEDSGVESRKVRHQLLQGWKSGVGARRHAEVDRQLRARVALAEGRGEALVEVGLQALDRADDRDMWNGGEWKVRGYGRRRR